MKKWANSGQSCLVIRIRNAINLVEDANSSYSLLSALYQALCVASTKAYASHDWKEQVLWSAPGTLAALQTRDFWVQSVALHNWAEGIAKWHQ